MLVLGEGNTFGINGSVGAPKKKFFSINFGKTKTNFFLSLHYSGDNSYLFVNRKKSVSLNIVTRNNIVWKCGP